MDTATALEHLCRLSRETLVLVADPNDGIAVVRHWDSETKRNAIFPLKDIPNPHDPGMQALSAIAEAAKQMQREALRETRGKQAVQIATLIAKIHQVLSIAKSESPEES